LSQYPPERQKQIALTSALVVLAEHNIPTDIQGLLVEGNPMRGIRPGALLSALREVAEENSRLAMALREIARPIPITRRKCAEIATEALSPSPITTEEERHE
jgi:hypothetical protein